MVVHAFPGDEFCRVGYGVCDHYPWTEVYGFLLDSTDHRRCLVSQRNPCWSFREKRKKLMGLAAWHHYPMSSNLGYTGMVSPCHSIT